MDYNTTLETDKTDLESLLESLSLDLMKDNILQQINYQTTSTTDFMSTIFAKFKVILEQDWIDDDNKREIRFQMCDFCDELILSISNHYNLFINQISDDYESKIEIVNTLYNFFVLNRFDNIERFFIAYINKYKNELIETLDIDDKSKDITSISNKKKNLSRENVCILSNITEIINFIKNNNTVDPVEFMELINDGEYYTDRLITYYQDAEIAGDYINILLSEVLNDDYDESEISRIRNNIRISFYN